MLRRNTGQANETCYNIARKGRIRVLVLQYERQLQPGSRKVEKEINLPLIALTS